MNRTTRNLLLVIGLVLLGGVIGTGLLAQETPKPGDTTAATSPWTCPMHPHVQSEGPGTCPICNMDLVERSSLNKPPDVPPGDVLYTCPMHLNVVESEPGSCPLCGMDLVRREHDGMGPMPDTMPASSPASAPARSEDKSTTDKPKERKIKHWVAPMDPTFISDKPGKSPMGMDLVPVYEGDAAGSTITIDPTVVQNMGVRIKPVTRQTIYRHIRTVGTVDVAEDEVSVVNLRYSGWIEHIYVDETGAKVKRGQPLFSIYSPEVVAAQQEYILAVKTQGADSLLARSARTRLSFWNIPKGQINRIRARGKPLRAVTVGAPRAGYVLHKNVVLGARVNAGMDVYRIGNLDRIWVNAEVYEFDAPWLEVGQKAEIELSFQRGRTFNGTVAYVYPTLNPRTRTLTVRLELDNPGLDLRPGMFATVRIEAQHKPDTLAVPTEAILHSGNRELVFVAVDLGKYDMREISTGVVGDRYLTEVLAGLREGERVVTSGQFLLDSESQLQEAVEKLLSARLHAKEKSVGGVTEDDQHEHSDTYWTCGMHPNVVEDGPGTCPICGMDLIEKKR